MAIVTLVLAFLFLALIFISAVIVVIGPGMLMQPYRRTLDYYRPTTTLLHPSDLPFPHEDICLMTAEGIPLSCWLIRPRTEPRGTVIYLHGVSECKITGLPMARLLAERGFNVFLYDARRHGDSGGVYCTYGFYEKHDPSTVISYLRNRSGLHVGKIGLFGASMGAAVAIQAAGIDSRIDAVAAESGFAALRTVFDDYQKRMIKLPWHYLRNIIIRRSERLAHFKANAVSPLESVKSLRIPLLIIHGAADMNIKPAYSRQVFDAANPPKELWLIPGARHDNVWEVGGSEYQNRIALFFEQALAGHNGSQ